MKDEFFFPYDASWKSRLQSQKLQGNIAPHHVSGHKPRCPGDVNGYRLDASLACLLRSTLFLLPFFWSQLDFRERKKASHSGGSAELDGVAKGSITGIKKEPPPHPDGTNGQEINQSINRPKPLIETTKLKLLKKAKHNKPLSTKANDTEFRTHHIARSSSWCHFSALSHGIDHWRRWVDRRSSQWKRNGPILAMVFLCDTN